MAQAKGKTCPKEFTYTLYLQNNTAEIFWCGTKLGWVYLPYLRCALEPSQELLRDIGKAYQRYFSTISG